MGVNRPQSEPEVERAVGVEDLDAVVMIVGHGHDPAGAEGDELRLSKLAVALSTRSGSDLIGKRAVGMEDIDVMVALVDYGHDPAGAEGNAAW